MSQGKTTTDHDEIRRWAEERGGVPASVKGTARGTRGKSEEAGILRLDFEPRDEKLEEISWEEFFEKFEESDLAFLYQEETARGKTSRFHKFISRPEGEERASAGKSGSRRGAKREDGDTKSGAKARSSGKSAAAATEGGAKKESAERPAAKNADAKSGETAGARGGKASGKAAEAAGAKKEGASRSGAKGGEEKSESGGGKSGGKAASGAGAKRATTKAQASTGTKSSAREEEPAKTARPASRGKSGGDDGNGKAGGRQSQAKSGGGGRKTEETGGPSANTTVDHDEIRQWAEERGGIPASVQGTERGKDDEAGILRLDFEPRDEKLEEISWEEFFEKFDESNLAFLYQEQTAGGKVSRFHKFISRPDELRGRAKPKASGASKKAGGGAKKAAGQKARGK